MRSSRFTLRLADLLIPLRKAPVRGRVIATPRWLMTLIWSLTGGSPCSRSCTTSRTTPRRCAMPPRTVERNVLKGRHWVLETSNGQGPLLAMCNFNAELPEVVQVGSVFTPPERRGQRLCARGGGWLHCWSPGPRGFDRESCSPKQDNVPARTAYTALGFQQSTTIALRC